MRKGRKRRTRTWKEERGRGKRRQVWWGERRWGWWWGGGGSHHWVTTCFVDCEMQGERGGRWGGRGGTTQNGLVFRRTMKEERTRLQSSPCCITHYHGGTEVCYGHAGCTPFPRCRAPHLSLHTMPAAYVRTKRGEQSGWLIAALSPVSPALGESYRSTSWTLWELQVYLSSKLFFLSFRGLDHCDQPHSV